MYNNGFVLVANSLKWGGSYFDQKAFATRKDDKVIYYTAKDDKFQLGNPTKKDYQKIDITKGPSVAAAIDPYYFSFFPCSRYTHIVGCC